VEIVISIRRIDVAVVASLIAHALLFAIPLRQHPVETLAGNAQPPMTVQLVEREASAPEEVSAAQPAPPAAVHPPVAPPPTPRARPKSVEPEPQPMPAPVPEPAPPRSTEPPMDMMAAINARREQRRAAEAAAARGTRPPTEEEVAVANIQRNLRDPGEGVGGVFQILHKGTRTAEFAFNGWRPDTERRWREVIEVDAGQGGDIERAIVKRMIELIRGHYSGDFRWESRNLGRIVVLSARPEDELGLEDFLIREFFGTPTLHEP
jgi:type IV secretory pathway VirB10-like protein